jgi:hypothetical protein
MSEIFMFSFNFYLDLGVPLRFAPSVLARVGLSAPSLASPLRGFASGSATIPHANAGRILINTTNK